MVQNRQNGDGGGNIQSASLITVRRTAAIGDVTASLVVADKLIENGFDVAYQAHPHMHCVLRRHGRISRIAEPGGYVHVNLDGGYEKDPARRRKHFYTMFLDRANEQLSNFGINLGPAINVRPRIRVRPNDRAASLEKFSQYAKPWVFICPRSDSYAVRQINDGTWSEAAARMQGTKFWIGRHPAPTNTVDLKCQHLDNVINWLSVADLLVSVDTGPLHLAAALGVPVVAIGQSSSPELHLGDQSDFSTIFPPLNCLNCQLNLCPINADQPPCQNVDPQMIADEVNRKLRSIYSDDVSAIVAIWKPKVEVLNQCLGNLVDQVDEIIVCAEGRSEVPAGAMQHPKIRYVRTTKERIGYSGNVNHGARWSRGKNLLFINDDCFLAPNAVAEMKRHMAPDIGIISNLLRYPDGSIYHAGKVRSPGVMGWGHIDHRHHTPSFKQVTELENCCGCCVLTPRRVFYDAGCYDEELALFSQDDAYALSVRRLGKKILFVPSSEGVHMEHQSVNKIGDVVDLLTGANKAFNRKWGAYLRANADTIPGNFDY